MMHIKKTLQNCSDDHLLRILFQNKHLHFFTLSFLHHLNNALNKLLDIDMMAYNDFIRNKLPAKHRDSFEIHSYISSLCELSVLYSFLNTNEIIESFNYEPCLRNDNNKNAEFSIKINSTVYNVEVKSPNLESHYKNIIESINKHGIAIRLDSRGIKKSANKYEIPSPTMRVKDFLVDANKKFPQRTKNVFNILFIAWDNDLDPPCMALKEPGHGLLVNDSDFKNSIGSNFKFDNIDFIFISDLYRNFLTHMQSGNTPIPSLISGVPYFENALQRVPQFSINPFLLPFSRNIFVNANCDLQNKQVLDAISRLPIAFYDRDVLICDEHYVKNKCVGVKFSFR